jgi:hypothetical protein
MPYISAGCSAMMRAQRHTEQRFEHAVQMALRGRQSGRDFLDTNAVQHPFFHQIHRCPRKPRLRIRARAAGRQFFCCAILTQIGRQ